MLKQRLIAIVFNMAIAFLQDTQFPIVLWRSEFFDLRSILRPTCRIDSSSKYQREWDIHLSQLSNLFIAIICTIQYQYVAKKIYFLYIFLEIWYDEKTIINNCVRMLEEYKRARLPATISATTNESSETLL